jgi:GNAT superfamily N-acetyltransferase
VNPLLRPGRPEDREAIEGFTRDTFSWGDYVARIYPDWLADPAGQTLVAEVAGEVVAVARSAMLSPHEAWLQGSRVHPEHRRRGLGTALAENLVHWAADRGARVVRLITETDNTASLKQVSLIGFRPECDWLAAEREVGNRVPVVRGNGGRRLPATDRLRPAPPVDAETAMLAWTTSPLERAGRGLFPIAWCWRRLRLADLQNAARRGALWQADQGWAIVEPDEDTLRVPWVATTAETAGVMMRTLVDHAAAAGAARIETMVPALDWLHAAVDRAGFRIHPMRIMSKLL